MQQCGLAISSPRCTQHSPARSRAACCSHTVCCTRWLSLASSRCCLRAQQSAQGALCVVCWRARFGDNTLRKRLVSGLACLVAFLAGVAQQECAVTINLCAVPFSISLCWCVHAWRSNACTYCCLCAQCFCCCQAPVGLARLVGAHLSTVHVQGSDAGAVGPFGNDVHA